MSTPAERPVWIPDQYDEIRWGQRRIGRVCPGSPRAWTALSISTRLMTQLNDAGIRCETLDLGVRPGSPWHPAARLPQHHGTRERVSGISEPQPRAPVDLRATGSP